jgi:pimeloyl-ACP methyl ester carboxylesterase
MTLTNFTGLRRHYALEGDLSHPVVVLSNLLGTGLSMWDAQVEALLPAFRVLRCDTRGHGKSELLAGPCTLSELVEIWWVCSMHSTLIGRRLRCFSRRDDGHVCWPTCPQPRARSHAQRCGRQDWNTRFLD